MNKKNLLYYQPKYLDAQKFAYLKHFESKDFCSFFNIIEKEGISITRAPFGGIITLQGEPTYEAFETYLSNVKQSLKTEGVTSIQIIQPPSYYNGFVHNDWMEKLGFKIKRAEINQFVDMRAPISMHDMQRRQLKKDWGFKFRKADSKELKNIHGFISDSRKEQGLEINISFDKLNLLFTALPDHYEAFVVEQGNSIACAAIMTKVTEDTWYYYLPATNASFRKQSPMVHLLNYLFDYYKNKDVAFLDLGVSSINGETQTSLFEFKERMGALATKRIALKLDL
ncbi:MAG: GNAT family N-acetyltransferase [Cyclobacteriaceae bacterium]